ncbi:MAG: DUF4091 domain-containing protein [Planctomycetaceae bacterium]|nr:DUF4091 domain-containing protein [Planctomycetaceae bacterium]
MTPIFRRIVFTSILCYFTFVSSVFSQIRLSDDNFLAPPKEQKVALTEPFTKNMKVGNTAFKVHSDGWKSWSKIGQCIENDMIRLDATEEKPSAVLFQTLTFDPPIKFPIALSAKCKGGIVKLNQDCALYLDVFYDDDTPLWGQAVNFPAGNYDFREQENSFQPAKPVKKILVHVLLRKAQGTAWFDDVYVGIRPLKPVRFQVIGGLFGRGSGAAVIRTNRADLESNLRLDFVPKDGISFMSTSFSEPLLLFTQTDSEVDRLNITCRSSLRGVEAVVAEEIVDIAPCDAGRGYCVWTTTSMERIFPYSLPRVKSDLGGAKFSELNSPEEKAELRKRLEKPAASIELARNEYESFQVGILSPKTLNDVEVVLSDLVSTADVNSRIESKHLDWKLVGFIKADQIRKHPADTEGGPGWWPDPLLPVERFDVPAGQTQPIWVTVYVPKGTKPGTYSGTVSLVPKNALKAEIPITVKVWNLELADEGHFQNAFAMMNGFFEKVYSMKPVTPELRKRYGDFMLKHRLTPEGDITRTDLPVIEELEYYRGRGLGTFNILNMVKERGDATWMCNSPLNVYTPEFKEKMLNRLKPHIEELRKHGLSKQAYIYTFDERKEDYADVMREYFGMVKEHFPEVKTFTTSYFVHTLEKMREMNVDWTCPVTSRYNFEEAERCRKDGRQVWSYICCGPNQPYANVMFRFPLIESRLLFWQSFHEKFDGLLYWGVNYWSQKGNVPIDPKKGPYLDWSAMLDIGGPIYGDGHLLYAGIDGQPIGSIRLANLRDGLEDYEYLYQVREKHKGNWDKARELCREIVPSLTEFSRNPSDLYQQRREVVRELGAGVPAK